MEIVIYDFSLLNQTRPFIPQPRKEAILLKSLGINLMVLAVFIGLYAVSPMLYKELKFRFGQKPKEIAAVKATFTQILRNEEISKKDLAAKEAKQYGVSTDFSLVVPKINAKAKVVPNVHPGSKEEYTAALKQGVAHAAGTSLPGENGTVFIFSHSTNADYNVERFNAVFYLLKNLQAGDKVIVFYNGLKYTYQVTDKQTVEAKDTNLLVDEKTEEKLVLSTCWPPGTSLKRLIIIAKPV